MTFIDAFSKSAQEHGLNSGSEILKQDVLLKPYTTFRAGGLADYFAEPTNTDELIVLLACAKTTGTDVFVLGNGSNILVSDKGYRGLVIKPKFLNFEVTKTDLEGIFEVACGSGMMLSSFGNACVKESLEGVEFCCGIPGTVGGAVFMNAGAYGREIKDFASNVTYLDSNLNVKTIGASECEFGYRHSIFEENKGIILELRGTLKKGDHEKIAGEVMCLRDKRIASQPLDMPSAGSTFKRPAGHFAGQLIEQSGLKGFKLDDSGAQVSSKHAGFVVNNQGTASASDIKRLIDYVIDKVYEDSGVRLETEVRLIGDFD